MKYYRRPKESYSMAIRPGKLVFNTIEADQLVIDSRRILWQEGGFCKEFFINDWSKCAVMPILTGEGLAIPRWIDKKKTSHLSNTSFTPKLVPSTNLSRIKFVD